VAGQLVAQDGLLTPPPSRRAPPLPASIHVDWAQVDLAIPAAGRRLRVIGALENQLVTEQRLRRRPGGGLQPWPISA
jgi:adenine deaminase